MNRNLIILAVLIAGIMFYITGEFPHVTDEVRENDSTPLFSNLLPPASQAVELELPPLTLLGTELTLSTKAWAVFQNYLQFAKNHDLSGIRSLSYQISATCNDPAKETECFALMDNVSAYANSYKLEDFARVESDEKQIVMYTDGPTVAMLYFIRSVDDIKVLGMRFCFEDETTVNTCVNTETIKNDSNNNGWWDNVESLFY